MDLHFKEGYFVYENVLQYLLEMEVKFNYEIQELFSLGTLLDSWETFRMSLCNSTPKGNVTLDLARTLF